MLIREAEAGRPRDQDDHARAWPRRDAPADEVDDQATTLRRRRQRRQRPRPGLQSGRCPLPPKPATRARSIANQNKEGEDRERAGAGEKGGTPWAHAVRAAKRLTSRYKRLSTRRGPRSPTEGSPGWRAGNHRVSTEKSHLWGLAWINSLPHFVWECRPGVPEVRRLGSLRVPFVARSITQSGLYHAN